MPLKTHQKKSNFKAIISSKNEVIAFFTQNSTLL